MKKKILIVLFALLSVVLGPAPAAHATGVQQASCVSQGVTYIIQVDSQVIGGSIRITGVWTRGNVFSYTQTGAYQFYANVQQYASTYSPTYTSWVRHTAYDYKQVPFNTIIQLRGNNQSSAWCYANVYL